MVALPKSGEAVKSAKSIVQKMQTIHSCNFRYAGRLSNENARTLTALHEKFAMNVTTALELYLGANLHLKLQSLEQMAIADYIGGIASDSYLVPCSLNVMESNLLMDMDIALIYPIIDLLLGGEGTALETVRELTEIDEEIMQSVTALIVTQIERAWQTLNLSLTAGRCIKPATIQQVFMMNEKLVMLMFEMTVGETTGSFKIVLPTSFVGFLLRHLNAVQSKKMSSYRQLRSSSLRERILDCDFVAAADVTQMRVRVRDLLELRPGMVLKMVAPVKRPGRITVEDVDIFEALPVRNGKRKAAQITARLQEPGTAKE
jgi:flagellar motor switch protein FliM